jgi:hypothetical protein
VRTGGRRGGHRPPAVLAVDCSSSGDAVVGESKAEIPLTPAVPAAGVLGQVAEVIPLPFRVPGGPSENRAKCLASAARVCDASR